MLFPQTVPQTKQKEENPMNITTIPVGGLEANCHIVSDAAGNAVLIDAGAEGARLLEFLKQKQLTAKAILLTHAHFDHMGAAAELQEALHIPVYVHRLDEPMLVSASKSLAVGLGYGKEFQPPQDIHTFEDGETLQFSEELTFTVIHTPGHTPGGSCFRHEDVLFSGDTLFRDSIGRVDFPGGNIKDMRASLMKIARLEGDCEVYCGHFMNTSLAHERQCSHYMNAER